MPYEPAIDSKVCRHCSVLALVSETRCRSCGGQSWGPIPDSLLHVVDPEVIRNGHGTLRLDGYRPITWPPPEADVHARDLPPLPKKDPDIAAMLASLCALVGIWGVGHIYVGKVITGLLLMITGAAVWGVFVLLTFIGQGTVFYALGVPAWAALIYAAYPKEASDPPSRSGVHTAGAGHHAHRGHGVGQRVVHLCFHRRRDCRVDIPDDSGLQPRQRIQRRTGPQRVVALVTLALLPG